ncbi:MAG: hypothetical protein M0P49_00810 [Bacilli bacterium]|nr:hypothetical protein [Bacilli bacterium]
MLNNRIGYMICETSAAPTDITVVGNANDRTIAEGILQDMNVRNRNGRFYDSRDLSPEINGPRMKELINAGYMRGECGHPMSKDIMRQQTIDPANVCVQYDKIWIDGNDIQSQFKGTNNRLGEDFDADLKDGCKPAFSLRALGTIENTKRGAEVKNIKVITFDMVIYPSHVRAYTNKILTESSGIVESSGSRLYIPENDKGLMIPITNDRIVNYIKQESCNLTNVMKTFDLLYESMELVNGGTQVRITDRVGSSFVIGLETHIQNEIMNYCEKF